MNPSTSRYSAVTRRPFLTGLSAANGNFVKTLALYHKANGDNWLNSLASWYASSGGSGTVPAGSFTTTWDGSPVQFGGVCRGSCLDHQGRAVRTSPDRAIEERCGAG